MASVKDNILELNGVIINLNKNLDENIKRLEAGAVAVSKFSKEFTNVPSGFQRNLQEIKDKTDKVAKSSQELSAIEKERIRVQKQLEQTNAKLATSTDKNTQALAKQKAELRANGSAYLLLSQAEQKAARTLQDIIAKGKLASETQAQYNGRLKQAQKEFEQLRARLLLADNATGRWNRTNERSIVGIKGIGTGLKQLLGAFGLFSGLYLFVGAIKDAFNTIKDFDKANADLAATMGKSRKEIKALTEDQKRLGASTKFTATEVASLQKEFAKLGFSQKEILNATEATLALAAATDTDLAKAAEVAGATLRGFGLDASEMARVTDVMALSFSSSALDMENFAESMKYVAPIAGQTGVSIEFTTAMLGKLADAGVKGSQAGTSLRRIMVEMAKTGKPAAEAFRQIAKEGISVTDAMDEVGRTAQTSLLVLSKSGDAVNELAKALENAGGAAQKMADEQLNSLQGQMTLLSSAWDGFILSLNNGNGTISRVFTNLIKLLNDVVTGFTYLNETAGETIKREAKALEKGIFDRTILALQVNYNDLLKERLGVTNKLAVLEAKLRADKNNESIKEEINLTKQQLGVIDDLVSKEREQIKANSEMMIPVTKDKIALIKQEIFELLARNKEIKYTLENEENSYIKQKALSGERQHNAKQLEELNKKLSAYNGELEAYISFTTKSTNAIQENTTATAKNKKEKGGLEQVEINSQIAFQRNISALEKQLKATNYASAAYGIYELQLKLLKDAYDALYGSKKNVTDLTYGTIPYYENEIKLLKEIQETVTNPAEFERYENQIGFYQQIINWIKGIKEETKEASKETDEWLKQYRRGFVDDFIGDSGFDKLFFLIENFDKLKESGKDTALAISEAFQQAFNTISELSQANFDAEYNRLERQKEIAIGFAGESTQAREEIDRQYEERKKQIARREAEQQKKLAIFNAIINTAQAVVAALPNLFLSAAIGVIGAAQIALISSQPVPQFYKGTDNAPEGMAWTQEKGAEIITDKKGNIKSFGSNKGAQLTYLNKGDKVYTAEKSKAYLNEILAQNGIMPMGSNIPSLNIVNNGISKEDLDNNFSKLANEIRRKENISINIDERGFRKSINGKESANNRLTGKSRSV